MADTFDFTDFLAGNVPAPAPRIAGARPRYDFAVAYPDPDSFPAEALNEALGRALKENRREMVLYPHVQGLPALRELIAAKLERQRGMQVDPDQVVLTPGSGQAISLFTQLFTDPGDTLITEELTYSGTLNVMRRFGANIVGVPLDQEGMRPDALDQTIQDLQRERRQPKFIYTIPTFQNPTGADMGPQRRQEILSVAQKHGVPIYEDDCYADLRFEGQASPAIHTYDDSGMVLYSGTFSKIVAPGMRLGWLVAPQEIVSRINAIHLRTPPSTFSALAALYYLRDHMDEHVEELCHIFKAKRDTMLGAVGESMGSAAVPTQPPGGLYLWVRLPEGKDTVPVLEKARERGVVYGIGPIYSPSGDAHNYFRLCFGYHDHQEIRDGIALLAEVFESEGLLK